MGERIFLYVFVMLLSLTWITHPQVKRFLELNKGIGMWLTYGIGVWLLISLIYKQGERTGYSHFRRVSEMAISLLVAMIAVALFSYYIGD